MLGRNTQGVRLIRLAEGERLTGIERVESLETATSEGDRGRGSGAADAGPPGESRSPPRTALIALRAAAEIAHPRQL